MPYKDTLHIYTRVSTEAQEEKGTSLDSQKELGIAEAVKLGFASKVWNEGGASSYYEDFNNRPVLLELLRKIEAGEVSHLWVYNNDRLSRNEMTAQTIRAALRKYNVILYTKDGTFNLNNAQDSLMKTILDGMAAFDNAMRADRTRLGKLNRVKQGQWMGGSPPFGYTAINKRLELHPEESKWVRRIYEWYAGGKAIHWIKSELEKNAVRTNRGNVRWTAGSIQKILKNTHPIGTWAFTDSKTDETVQCECPSIISTSLWNSCQKQRIKILERKGQNNRTTRFYMLRNFMYCGHCGSPMAARTKEAKNEYLYYCPRKERQWKNTSPQLEEEKWARGRGCSMTKSLNIHRTDDFVWETVIKSMFEGDEFRCKLEKYMNEGQELDNPEASVQKARNLLKRLNKEKTKLIEDIASVETSKILGTQDRLIADKVLLNLRLVHKDYEAKIEQAELHLNEMLNKNDLYQIEKVSLEEAFLALGVEYKTNLTPQTRKIYLERLIEKITVYHDKASNEHALQLDVRFPIMTTTKDKRWKDGTPAQKKTIAINRMATPEVDNIVTVE